MSKRKSKDEKVRRLKYNGVDGNPNISGIPARDIEHHELIDLSERWDMSIDAFIELLCSDTRGRRIAPGEPLYSANKPYICNQCKEEFSAWEDLHEHALTHTIEAKEEEVKSDG